MSELEAHNARAALEDRWLVLTRDTLPALALARGWPIRNDHCFQRVLLDAACRGRWYDHIEGRPAYRRASDAILGRAVAIAVDVVDGSTNLSALNRQSLVYRGKA